MKKILNPDFTFVILSLAALSLSITLLILVNKFSLSAFNISEKNKQAAQGDSVNDLYQCTIGPLDERVQEKGIIRKEKDPRDLGQEYMYIFVFDTPFLMWANSSGLPQYIDSIVISSVHKQLNLEEYVNKHTEIAGNIVWGYAESRAIEVLAIRTL